MTDRAGTKSNQTAYGLLMGYEQTLAEIVEATLSDALARTHADVAVRRSVADAWRDSLTVVAAEELSRRHATAAARGARVAISPSALRRALRPYGALVTAAAAEAMRRQPAMAA